MKNYSLYAITLLLVIVLSFLFFLRRKSATGVGRVHYDEMVAFLGQRRSTKCYDMNNPWDVLRWRIDLAYQKGGLPEALTEARGEKDSAKRDLMLFRVQRIAHDHNEEGQARALSHELTDSCIQQAWAAHASGKVGYALHMLRQILDPESILESDKERALEAVADIAMKEIREGEKFPYDKGDYLNYLRFAMERGDSRASSAHCKVMKCIEDRVCDDANAWLNGTSTVNGALDLLSFLDDFWSSSLPLQRLALEAALQRSATLKEVVEVLWRILCGRVYYPALGKRELRKGVGDIMITGIEKARGLCSTITDLEKVFSLTGDYRFERHYKDNRGIQDCLQSLLGDVNVLFRAHIAAMQTADDAVTGTVFFGYKAYPEVRKLAENKKDRFLRAELKRANTSDKALRVAKRARHESPLKKEANKKATRLFAQEHSSARTREEFRAIYLSPLADETAQQDVLLRLTELFRE